MEMGSSSSLTWSSTVFRLAGFTSLIYSFNSICYQFKLSLLLLRYEYTILLISMSVCIMKSIMIIILLTKTFTFWALWRASMYSCFAIMAKIMIFQKFRDLYFALLYTIIWQEINIGEFSKLIFPFFFSSCKANITDSILFTLNFAYVLIFAYMII